MIFPVSRFTRKAKGVIRKTGSESFRPFRNHAFILWQSTHHFQLAVPVWFFAAPRATTWEMRWVPLRRGTLFRTLKAQGLWMNIEEEIAELKAMVRELLGRKAIKDYYSTAEVANRVGRSEYQVREWCRTGRIQAVKRNSGRGAPRNG